MYELTRWALLFGIGPSRRPDLIFMRGGLQIVSPRSRLNEGVREFQAVGGDSVGDRGLRMVQSPSETPPTVGFPSSQFPDTFG
jgi:hypothetical protein